MKKGRANLKQDKPALKHVTIQLAARDIALARNATNNSNNSNNSNNGKSSNQSNQK